MASAYRMKRVRAFSFWRQPCQGVFLLDAAVSGDFPSGRSRVRGFSYGCSRVRVKGDQMTCMEHCSKYSCCIHKHTASFRHSDSVQFYSFYLMYIYILYSQGGGKQNGRNMISLAKYRSVGIFFAMICDKISNTLQKLEFKSTDI